MHLNLLSSHMYARDAHVFLCRSRSRVMRAHSPSPFLHSRRVVVECLRRMRCISLWSVCPRGPLRPLLSSAHLELCISLPRAPDAPAPPVACPLDPAPRARQVKAAMSRRRLCAVHEPAICGYDRSFAALSIFSTLSVSFTTGPLVASQDPLWLLLGGNGVGVLTGNERYFFPPAFPTSRTLRGVFGGGG